MNNTEKSMEEIGNWEFYFNNLLHSKSYKNYMDTIGYYPIELKIFRDEVKIENYSQLSLKFFNCTFEKRTIFKNLCESNEIHFWECDFKEQFDIHHCQIDSLDIARTKASNIQFISNKIRTTRIMLKDLSSIQIFGGKHEILDIVSPMPSIDTFDEVGYKSIMVSSYGLFGELNISPYSAINVVFTGQANHTKININYIKVQSVIFHDFFTRDGINMNSIIALNNDSSEFILNNSFIGKSIFHNINFNLFHNVIIKKSFISDSTFNNVVFPMKIYVIGKDEIISTYEKSLNVSKELREVYRQLKIASKRNEDTISEQFFYGLELSSYLKSLNINVNLSEKLIIYFSKVTSNFGQSIFRPFILLIIFQFIFIFLLLLTSNIEDSRFTMYLNNTTSESNFKVIKEYFKLISPINEFISNNYWGILIESIMKVWNSYMIYNFIRASRRFIK